ncbi:MAG TPA: hypothetical protein VGL98_19435 [Gammaproteobacteria bacterium]
MKAAVRVWWTFFTAVPLQRVLGVIGAALFGLAVIGWLLVGERFFLPVGYILFVTLAVVPALFSAPALFRLLSAPRMHQLLPHFRSRMLLAASLLLGTLLVAAVLMLTGPTLASERALPLGAISYPLAFLVGMFLVLFLAFGDWRWSALLPLGLVTLTKLRELSPATAGMLAATPVWVWSAIALGAWAGFAAWYLRVRQVRGFMRMPQPRSNVNAAVPVPRAVAVRVLLASIAPRTDKQQLSPRNAPLLFLAFAVVIILITQGLRFFSLASVFWPLALMLLFGERSMAIVQQSRLLWLRVPGARDAVRRQVEQALWRNLGMGCGALLFLSAIAASPLVGLGAAEVVLGFVLSAGAAIYATYVAMAAVPGVAMYFWGFGSMMALQIALLIFTAHSPTAVAIVAAVELVGAALLRALAVRRWRTIDWLRLKALPSLAGVPHPL